MLLSMFGSLFSSVTCKNDPFLSSVQERFVLFRLQSWRRQINEGDYPSYHTYYVTHYLALSILWNKLHLRDCWLLYCKHNCSTAHMAEGFTIKRSSCREIKIERLVQMCSICSNLFKFVQIWNAYSNLFRSKILA